MDEFFEGLMEDKNPLGEVDEEKLRELSKKVQEVWDVNTEIDKLESQVKFLKQQRNRITQDEIPALMDEANMLMGRFSVGESDNHVELSLKPFVSGKIPEANREKAYQWLRDNNFDSIIKNDITLSFQKDQDATAQNLMLELEDKGYHPEFRTHIHAQTYKAFIRECQEKGIGIDLDLFGAFVGRVAEIKRK